MDSMVCRPPCLVQSSSRDVSVNDSKSKSHFAFRTHANVSSLILTGIDQHVSSWVLRMTDYVQSSYVDVTIARYHLVVMRCCVAQCEQREYTVAMTCRN
jgi:hypothetical protein